MADLREDLAKNKKLLEDITGFRVYGNRAPSFSIGDDILRMTAEAGYFYDSSYNSFAMHGRYGEISLNGTDRDRSAYRISDGFYEPPISNLHVFHFSTLGTSSCPGAEGRTFG
jgi:peptidoglycan/xylan/chitin deacetylase (PgdA/CDA1 family)